MDIIKGNNDKVWIRNYMAMRNICIDSLDLMWNWFLILSNWQVHEWNIYGYAMISWWIMCIVYLNMEMEEIIIWIRTVSYKIIVGIKL